MKVIQWFKLLALNSFSKESHLIGWMMLWRWIIVWGPFYIFLHKLFLSRLIGAGNLGDVVLLVFVSLILAVLNMLLLNIVGKKVAVKKYQKDIKSFIGWSIFWRSQLYQLSLMLLGTILLLILFFIYDLLVVLVLLPVIVYIWIITYGWSARRSFEIHAAIPLPRT